MGPKSSFRGCSTFLATALLLSCLSLNSFGQGNKNATSGSSNPQLSVNECEDETCVNWRFNGWVGFADRGGGNSSVLLIRISNSKDNSVAIDRYDFGGPKDGLVATYTGTEVSETRFQGTYTWQGSNQKQTWSWNSAALTEKLPLVMHFCPGNCFTLTQQRDHYVAWPVAPNVSDTYKFDKFTKDSVILHRTIRPDPHFPGWPNGEVIFKGRISDDGEGIIFESENGGTNNIGKYRLTWGTALNNIPGKCSDCMGQPPSPISGNSEMQTMVQISFQAFLRELAAQAGRAAAQGLVNSFVNSQ